MSLVTFPRQFLVDINGTPRVGAKATFLQAGTSTLITVYTTPAHDVPHENPVKSVAGGLFPAVYVNPAVNPTYKLLITDSTDVPIPGYPEDNIPTTGLTQAAVGAALYPTTDAEDAVAVTPSNKAYREGWLPRYGDDWLSAFKVSSQAKVKVRVPGGSYSIATQVEHTGDVDVECLGPVTITCAAASTISSVFKVTGKLKWSGARTIIDGDDETYLAIHCPTVLPELEDITFKNTLSVAGLFGRNFDGASTTGYSGTNGTGHGYMKNCRGENCGTFVFGTGSGISSDTSFGLIDCATDDNCGDVSNLFALNHLGYGYVRGGLYLGASTTAPNMTQTGRCEYIGGRYEGMLRGPTTGESSGLVTIVGGITKNCTFSGVSVDARNGDDDSVPYVTGKVDWTVEGVPTHGVFVQASGIDIAAVRYIGDGTATSSNNVVRLTDSLDVAVGDVSAYDAGGSLLVNLGSGAADTPGSSAFKTGFWQSDTTSTTTIRTNADSTLTMKPLRTIITDSDLSYLEDAVRVDASAGTVDLDVPDATAVGCDVIGHQWLVVVIDSTNDVTITRDSGGATAINGGASFTVRSGSGYTHVLITSLGGGNYAVTTPVLSGAAPFTLTNETEDTALDADAAAVAETNDVLATLIKRLKLGT